MADVKISGLPASTTPLAGTEVLPIVQGGVTKQVAISDLTAGRNIVVGTGTVAAPTITPTGDSNTGILFPAADTIAFAEGGAEAMRIDSTGRAIVGASSSTPTFGSAQSRFQVAGADFQTASASVICNNASDQAFGVYLSKLGGTIFSNFTLGIINFGFNTSSSAKISCTADGNHSAGSTPGNLRFFTTPSGATNVSERMRISAAGDVTVSTGNLVIGTSGKGIDFSATAGAGTSELLADYEEGTWTPTDASGAGLTIAITAGTTPTYTKIGRLVVCSADVTYPVTADATTARLSMPFTPSSTNPSGCGVVGFKANGIFMTGSTGATGSTFLGPVNTFLTNANLSGVRFNMTWTFQV